MKSNSLLILCLNVVTIMSNPPEGVILSIMDMFGIDNPIIINLFLKTNQHEVKKLFKLLLINGHTTSAFKNQTNHQFQSFIVLTELHNFEWEIQTKSPTIVITNIKSESELAHVKLSLDSEIYFIDKKSFMVYETYTINNVHVAKYLGQFKIENGVSFIADKDFHSLLVKRRGNFHGIQIKAMVEYEPPMIDHPLDFASKVTYFSNNQTYLMTNICKGVFIDVLNLLQERYNFSTELYKRKDGAWGVSEQLPNGTYICGFI